MTWIGDMDWHDLDWQVAFCHHALAQSVIHRIVPNDEILALVPAVLPLGARWLNKQTRRLRNWIPCCRRSFDPRVNRMVKFGQRLHLRRAECRAARQVGYDSNEAFVFVAPEHV